MYKKQLIINKIYDNKNVQENQRIYLDKTYLFTFLGYG